MLSLLCWSKTRLQNSRFFPYSEGAKRRKHDPRVWSARASHARLRRSRSQTIRLFCTLIKDLLQSSISLFLSNRYYIPLFICIIGLFITYIYIFVTHRRKVSVTYDIFMYFFVFIVGVCFACKLSVNCNRFALCFPGLNFISRRFSIPLVYCIAPEHILFFLNQVVSFKLL